MGLRDGVAPTGGRASGGGAVRARRRGGWCGLEQGLEGALYRSGGKERGRGEAMEGARWPAAINGSRSFSRKAVRERRRSGAWVHRHALNAALVEGRGSEAGVGRTPGGWRGAAQPCLGEGRLKVGDDGRLGMTPTGGPLLSVSGRERREGGLRES
jgi:hypothetical protein